MPKEVIKYVDAYVVRDERVHYNPDEVKSGEELKYTMGVALHWDKNSPYSEVQLSVSISVEQLRALVDAYDKGEWLGEADPGTLRIFTEPLKRQELQRMIKHARAARDDVHGADE